MGYISSQRARIQARITTKEAQLTAANASYTALLGEEVESYRFDSGEGAQQVKRRKLEDMLKVINNLENEIDYLYRKLYSNNLVVMNLRRKAGFRF